MIPRVHCPDCNQVQVVLERPAGRWVARCVHCRRLWPPELEGPASGDAGTCNEHPGRRTRWICDRCDLAWCAPCGRRVRTHGFDTSLSPCCREGLHPVTHSHVLRPFWSELPAVMLYAFRGGSPFVLVFLFLGGFVPILAWTIPVFAAAYGVHVTRCSGGDPYAPPGFPEPDDILTDFLYPLFRLLGASLVAWLPWLLYLQFGPNDPNPLLQTGFLVLGMTVYPAIVLLAVARDALLAALAPNELVRTIRLMGRDYLAAVLAVGLFFLAWKTTGRVAAEHDFLALAMRFVRFYLLITIFHILGRAVWQTRHRIDWGI